jgi:hypothetical protein
MRALQLGVVVACGLSCLPIAQGLPPTTRSGPSNRQSITARGCIKGQTLVETGGDFAPGGTKYRLRGPKNILATLKEHDGHEDEVIGTTEIADDRKFKVTKEKKSGKARVYGSRSIEEQGGRLESDQEPWVDVQSITHLSSRCAGK